MRNLKRALSLALASIMVLGLMVVGSSAAESYTDVTAEHNVEAIDVLQSVDPAVMEGVGEGKFEPETELTRGMMAVIMCRLLDYTVGSYKGTSPFTDVPAGHWAEEFVAACYTNKITAGVSATEYGVDEKVTTGQAGLMILKALGYFQEPGDFGADWLVETVRVGSQAGLFDGIKNGARDALTRNDAAQMCLNALETEMVEIGSHDLSTGVNGQLTTKAVYVPRTGGTGENKYKAVGSKQYLGDETIELGEFLYDGDLKKSGTSDDFGRPATAWRYKSKSVGTYADSADYTYANKVTKGTLYSDVGKSVVDSFPKDGDKDYDLTVYVDGTVVAKIVDDNGFRDDGTTSYTLSNIVDNLFKNNSTAHIDYYDGTANQHLTGNGVATEVYVDSSAYLVTICVTNTYVMQATGDYSESSEELNIDVLTGPCTDSKLELEDVPNLAEFSEDDYMLYTYAAGEVQTVTKANVVTGEVESLTKDSVTLDGKKYSYANTYKAEEDEDNDLTRFSVGEDAALVTFTCGDNTYLMWVDDSVFSAGNYLYISHAEQSVLNRNASAAAYSTDGVYEEITVKKAKMWNGTSYVEYKAGDEIASNVDGAPGWYSYSKDANGQYTLTQAKTNVSKTYKDGEQALMGEAVAFMGATASGAAVTSGKGNAKTVFVVDDGSDVNVYTGVANTPNVTVKAGATNKAVVSYIKVNDKANETYAALVFVDAGKSDVVETSSSDDLLYVLKQDSVYTDKDNDKVYVYHVVRNGSLEKGVEAADDLMNGSRTMYYKVRTDSNDRITDGSQVFPNTGNEYYKDTALNDVRITAKNDAVTIGGQSFILNGDSEITLIAMASSGLAKDGESYEIFKGANTLNSKLKNYVVDGEYYAVTTDSDNTIIKSLYVVVTDTGAAPDPESKTAVQAVVDETSSTYISDDMGVVSDPVVNDADHTITVNAEGVKGSSMGSKNIVLTLTEKNGGKINTKTSETVTLTTADNGENWTADKTISVVSKDEGDTQTYTVTVNLVQGKTATPSFTGAPTATATKTITGTGATVTVALSGSTTAPAYQWYDGDTSIGGATSASYDYNGLDAGKHVLTCKATDTGTDLAVSDAATSQAVTVVVFPTAATIGADGAKTASTWASADAAVTSNLTIGSVPAGFTADVAPKTGDTNCTAATMDEGTGVVSVKCKTTGAAVVTVTLTNTDTGVTQTYDVTITVS